jgi:outer membrane protein assembly factor BamB
LSLVHFCYLLVVNEPATNSQSPARPARPIRWWPVAVILLLAVVLLAWMWARPDLQRQNKHLGTAAIALLTGFLLFLWFAFFSRLPGTVRLYGGGLLIAGTLLLAAAFGSQYELRGFTGDFLPIFERRSTPRDSERIAREQPLPMGAPADAPATVQPTPDDFPQFMGPGRNCVVTGPKLATNWGANPPKELWRQPVGPAWSGFAIVGGVAVTQEQRGDDEMVIAYDLATGRVLWSHADKAHYSTPIAGEGPRATPTIEGGRVFTLGATGKLNCLELTTGKTVWSVNVVMQQKNRVPEWGLSSSPLVVSNLVIVHPGKEKPALAAYHRDTGDLAWTGGDDGSSYGSPFPATLVGVEQILSFNNASISAHAPGTGEVLWTHPWNANQPKVALPVLLPDDRVLFSSGYGVGAELLHVTKDDSGNLSARQLWKTLKLKAKFTNLIHKDGHIYGLDDGIMVCVEAATGVQKWKDGRYGHGQIILTGNVLIVMAESGDLVLVEPAPDQLRELARIKVFADKTWNPPALAGDLLLLRNHKEAACYRLPVVAP